ncbi:pantetheinase-like [Haliotis rufescens]|uniref:pantetheinase-like n=1 Tax=Haliotis rufescens TaxID=6454 RepID=UPI00201F07F5|nr:pantetheinase-like [Haliotis rufescens]
MDRELGCCLVTLMAGWVCMAQATPLTYPPGRGGYKAAVYEHAVHIPWGCLQVPVSRGEAVRQMMKNIQVYKTQAAAASREGADIIVFPEDGIYGMIFNRNTIKPFLEEIPDPRITEWNPCLTSGSDTDTTIQRELSCMARENAMYVIANMGDRKPCHHSNDPKCPDDDQYQYNTDVAFNPEGVLVARYHKRHLFQEDQFDTPPLELATFETPFGKFGLFTCFDILFYNPGVELIQKEGIRNMVFPTAWMDRLPYLAAIEFHSAFAKGLGVNVLAANIHYPVFKFQGSGIYTPTGSATYYYNDGVLSGGRLLLADVDSVEETGIQDPIVYSQMKMENWRVINMKENKKVSSSLVAEERSPDKTDSFIDMLKLSRLTSLPRENYTFVPLEHHTGTQRACREDVCCTVVYTRENLSALEDLFVLAVFNGFDDGRFTQTCSVLMCPDNDMSSCGDPVKQSRSMFSFMEISGNLSSPYIFPEVLVSDGQYIGLVQGEWTFKDGVLHGGNGFSKPLITASLFGRLYSRDKVTLT